MVVRKTVQIGDPRLKAKNVEIKDFSGKKLEALIQDLTDTMHDVDLIGIAVCQG